MNQRCRRQIVSVLALPLICHALLLNRKTEFRRQTPLGATPDSAPSENQKQVVIIGGGWAGFSAADALSTSKESVRIDLLDASPRGPGGLAGGWRTPILNRPVEAGLHGFWREYRNTFEAVERIGLSLDDVLTPYTPSMLVSKSGKVALAPVLGEGEEQSTADFKPSLSDLTNPKTIAELLPPPLDVALLSEFEEGNPLTAVDRLSALGLLGVWADFEQEDPKSWEKYDKISADSLFRAIAGVTPALYEELVSPLLHVLPMTPGYDCSAASALSCFHVFALQARGAFDVRWCRGTISEKIFDPWVQKLTSTGNVHIRGASRVTSIEEIPSKDGGDPSFEIIVNDSDKIECDAIVLAVGGTAMKKLLPNSSVLSNLPDANGWKKFRGVTCVAVRLFLKPSLDKDSKAMMIPSIAEAMKDSPVAVCGPKIGNIPELSETGFCIYDLQRLQDEFGLSDESVDSVALEVDFFRADALADIEDDNEVAKLTLKAVSAALGIDDIYPEALVDMSVIRARDAVSHFCVNSASWSPQMKLKRGVYICGDWIDRTGHASWSTEKSVVTARQAVAELANDFGMVCDTDIIPAAAGTAQLSALRKIARGFRSLTPDIIPPAPWVLAKRLSRSN